MHTPHPKSPGLAAGVTEDMIRELVHAFYATVRRDPLLGPIFNAKVGNWDEHLTTLCRFWSSVMLLTGAYKGRPMVVHAALPDRRTSRAGSLCSRRRRTRSVRRKLPSSSSIVRNALLSPCRQESPCSAAAAFPSRRPPDA